MKAVSDTTNMTIRIDKQLKKKTDALFKELGISTNSAINMFLKQCDREQRLVFNPSLGTEPSAELKEAINEVIQYKNGEVELGYAENVASLRKALIDED